jgi:glucosylceramidase
VSPTPPTERAAGRLDGPGDGLSPGALGVTAALLALVLVGLLVLVIVHPWTIPVPPLRVAVTVTGRSGRHGQSPAPLLASEPALRAPYGKPPGGTEVIRVNSAVARQQIQGFGSAMTDSSAWLLDKRLSPVTRTRVMDALFSARGIHLTNLRIPMGASDFTATGVPYSYDDLPRGDGRDPKLAHFSVAHDNRYILPALRAALARDDGIGFIATPWSVPNWMKANDRLSNQGNTGTVKPADYAAYAQYFVDFLLRYEAAGIEVGEVTPANEPTTATRYPGMNIPAATETKLISDYLVPALRDKGIATLVYGADLGFQNVGYARQIATGAAARDLSGIAWHCYYGSPTVMSQVHALNPKLGVQLTECSPGIATEPLSEIVVESLRNDASVVDLWNLALDDRGGPVQPPNHGCPGCYGLLAIDTATGAVRRTDAYAGIGQASEFIEPGAVRVKSNTFVRYRYTGPGRAYVSANVDDVAVRNPDGTIVLVAVNNAATPKRISVSWHGYAFTDTLAAGETASFRWR